MYVQRLAENLFQKGFFIFEICSFEVDAYMYVQKTFFLQSRPPNLTAFLYDKARELKFAELALHR